MNKTLFHPFDIAKENDMRSPLDFNRRSRLMHVDRPFKAEILNIIRLTDMEKLFQIHLQTTQVQQAPARLEFHEEIHIAPRIRFSPRHRPENPHRLGAVLPRNALYLVAVFLKYGPIHDPLPCCARNLDTVYHGRLPRVTM